MSGMCVWESLCLIIWLSLSHPEPRALQSSGLNCPSFHCQARRVLVCFFLSSTCMTVIWNSTIIRTARKRGPGSCLLELAWQYFYPPSPVSCPLELSFLSFSLMTHFFTLSIGFSIIFSLYVFLKVCFITSILYCIIFFRRPSTHSHPLCLGVVWLGCLCIWLTFSYSTIVPHARRGNNFPVCFSFWPMSH